MRHQELDRVKLIAAVTQRQCTQVQAAQQLRISKRPMKRLVRRYRTAGAAGLASRRRGRPINNRIDASVRRRYPGLVRAHYPDSGPTFAHEKLAEKHAFPHPVETLRQWMIKDGLGRTRRDHTGLYDGAARLSRQP